MGVLSENNSEKEKKIVIVRYSMGVLSENNSEKRKKISYCQILNGCII